MGIGVDEQDLFARWWDFQHRARGTRAERKALEAGEPADVQAAYDTIEALVAAGAPDTVELLVALNDAGPPEDQGGTVGAGPLEDLICTHGDSLAETIERCARQSPSFAKALSNVWLERADVSPATEQRLARWIRSDS